MTGGKLPKDSDSLAITRGKVGQARAGSPPCGPVHEERYVQ